MVQTSFLHTEQDEFLTWKAKQHEGAARLNRFLPRAGIAYARQRNFDLGRGDRSNVSALSPWVRHRLILEEDILRKVLARHGFNAAEKFIQEVFWRGYFKGWLEHRLEVWQRYKQALIHNIDLMEKDASLARRYEDAVNGKVGIDCFDTWSRELIETGYLHNHARMWFASIWIFTLKLPWELGADFFYRHLLDGDPASNTCSWRWVGGLHTKGKTYLARADNIARYTNGRFNPVGQLATEALPLTEPELKTATISTFNKLDLPGDRIGLLITEEDCSPDSLPLQIAPLTVLALNAPSQRSVLPIGDAVRDFASDAVKDAAHRAGTSFACDISPSDEDNWADVIREWSNNNNLDAILTARLPIGPVAKKLRSATKALSIPLIEISRDYDRAVWPHAKRGFFGLKKKLPNILNDLKLA